MKTTILKLQNKNFNFVCKTILTIVTFTFLTLSCNKDDDPAPPVDPIVGTWKLTKAVTTDAIDMNGDGTPKTNMLLEDVNGCFDECVLILKEDDGCLGLFNSFDTHNDNSVYVTQSCFDYYEESENKWIKNNDGKYFMKRKDDSNSLLDSFTFEIIDNKLVCTNFQMYQLDDVDAELSSSHIATLTFTRQ